MEKSAGENKTRKKKKIGLLHIIHNTEGNHFIKTSERVGNVPRIPNYPPGLELMSFQSSNWALRTNHRVVMKRRPENEVQVTNMNDYCITSWVIRKLMTWPCALSRRHGGM